MSEKIISGVIVNLISPSGVAATMEPTKARVTLNGPVEYLQDFDPGKIKLTANAKELAPGKHKVLLEAQVANGVKVTRVEPSDVTVTLVDGNE